MTDRYLWYEGETACTECGPGSSTRPNGTTYIYDTTDGSETPSLLTQVLDVWPRPDTESP